MFDVLAKMNEHFFPSSKPEISYSLSISQPILPLLEPNFIDLLPRRCFIFSATPRNNFRQKQQPESQSQQ